MALYLKRLKGNRIIVNNPGGISHPYIVADRVFNPVLEYLYSQYNELAEGIRVPHMHRDSTSSADESWWENDYSVPFCQKFNEFNAIVQRIKEGTLQKTEDVIDELYQAGKGCADALFNLYCCHCLCYEISTIINGGKAEYWWFLYGYNVTYEKIRGVLEPGSIGGVTWATIDIDEDGQWIDKPYEFDVNWWDHLKPWYWFSDDEEIISDKKLEKTGKYKKYLEKKDKVLRGEDVVTGWRKMLPWNWF